MLLELLIELIEMNGNSSSSLRHLNTNKNFHRF
jgi:hypothetical protein